MATEFLKQHMSVHTDKRTFKCDICEKTLTGYKTFANHKKCHMTWTCDICEQIIPLNYSFKKEERTHGFKVKRVMGTPTHLEKSLKSLIRLNSKRAGFSPPSKLQLRNNSPYNSPYSSPFSSPSKR